MYIFEQNIYYFKILFADICTTETGHFGLFDSPHFRPLKIGKNWIASGFRPRNAIKSFRPNVLKKGTAEPTKRWFLISTTQIKRPITKVIGLFMGRVVGFEPTHNGTTIRGLNHLTTPAIFAYLLSF